MIKLTIPDISCGHCIKAVTDTITGMDAAATVHADLSTKTVSVESALTETVLRQVLTDAGYPPAP